MTWIAIGLAGALGALARYGLSGWVYDWAGVRMPWGTLAVNMVGCLALGALAEATRLSGALPLEVRAALAVGFLGAFTTFSTFGVETLRQIEAGDWIGAFGNIALNVVGGIALAMVGVSLARWIVSMRGLA